jgi:NAD(P)H dehydrogenase (quinone)
VGGDAPFTLADLAAEVGRRSGREVTAVELPADEYAQVLVGAGLDDGTAGIVAGIDTGIAAGELDAGGHGIGALTGRPTRTLAEHVATVLATPAK